MTAAAAVQFRYRIAVPSWTVSEEDERRFRRILRDILIVSALLCLIMPWLPVPKADRNQPEELPPRLAKALLEREPPPPPVVREPEPEAAKPEASKPAHHTRPVA